MSVAFVVCFVVGLVGIVGSFVVGELGELTGGAGGDGMPILGPTTIATALFGIGAGGMVAAGFDLGVVSSLLVAVLGGGVLVSLTHGLLLPYLLRQQANSHVGRDSYIGALGTVTLALAHGGWGEVSFTDEDGGRVRARAVTEEPRDLPVGTRVYIADVDSDYVHVVAVPDSSDPDLQVPESN